MIKRPAFQFYPSDWRKDQGLRLCSMAARGLWIDMLCLMHEAEPYGHLTVLGRPMTADALAKLIGESPAAVKRWLGELAEAEVYSTTEAGVIFSRRMVRDEEIREARAAGGPAGAGHGAKGASFGSRGGRPRKEEGGNVVRKTGVKKPPLKPPLKPPPSSSSSSAVSSEDKSSGAEVAPDDFDAAAWQSAVKCLTAHGGTSEKSARGFFGKLLSENGLQARDLLPAITNAMINHTGDPQAYLRRAAQGVASRRVRAEPKRVGFV